jgi:hypothetical protein
MSASIPENTPPRFPRKMLLGDEGNSALHYVDLDVPHHNWTYRGRGRDLQLIGKRRVLRSQPQGYVELDLANMGRVVRDVAIANVPGDVESARRLPNGNTIIAGNGGGGIFVWEIDAAHSSAGFAIKHMKKAIEMDPHCHEAFFQLGLAFLEQQGIPRDQVVSAWTFSTLE